MPTPNPAIETDAAQPVGKSKDRPVVAAVETDATQPIGRTKAVVVGIAPELDTAKAIRPGVRVKPASESDAALPLGAVVVHLRAFTPPTFEERMYTPGQRLFTFFTQTMSFAVVFRNGHYQNVRVPSQEETDALVEGKTWFSGGRTYTVDRDTANLLKADGYTTSPDLGPFGGL